MPGDEPPSGPEFAAWNAFATRRAGNPHLAADPLYALPEPLIDAIKEQLPKFFGWKEEEFERALVRTAHGGFFLHRPFDCLLLSGPPDEKQAALDQEIRAEQTGLMKDAGTTVKRIRDYFDAEATAAENVEERRLAYCGWLVMNDQFRQESDIVRNDGEELVAAEGGFPSLPRSFLGETPSPTNPDHLPFYWLYRRWGLERLITWDLPCPLEPELSGIVTHDWATLGEAGVTVFVPWYLLKDKNIQLDKLVEHLGIYRNPVHLRGWMEPKTGGKNPLGYVRLGNLMKLYRFWHLALATRYQLTGKTGRLDKAFAKFLKRDAQSIRKLRLKAKAVAED